MMICAALLLLLLQLHGCTATRVAVVVQGSIIQPSLVSSVFDRVINNNWKFPVFKSTPLNPVFLKAADAIEAIQKVCTSSGLSAVVTVGSCSFVTDLLQVSSSMGLPTIVISNDLCDLNSTNDMALISTPSSKHFMQAAVAVLKSVSADKVAIFYDRFQDHAVIETFQQQLSVGQISSATFQVDASSSNLTRILSTMIKANIRYNAIMADAANVKYILREAQTTGTLQINYFWTVLDSGIQLSGIGDLLPANGSANILVIRESGITLSGWKCTAEFITIFPDCNMSQHTMVELKTVEALLSLASALQNMTDSGQLTDSNATCQPLQAWTGGTTAAALLRQQSMSLSTQNSWLPSEYFLETVATFQDQFTDPIEFVLSGRYFLGNASLTVTFLYRERSLIFPNKFIDFKNRSLKICSPANAPYTTYSNGTVGTPRGITVDLLKFFAKHLNFTYKVFTPPDNQFGAPVPGSQYFSGCIGMVQKGEADFAMPIAISNVRYQVIEYSEEFLFSSTSILVKRPMAESKLWNMFTPLAWDSWLLIVAMFVIVPTLIYIFARLSPFSAWNLKLPFAFADEVWLKEYIWSVIGSFLQQGQDFYPVAMSPRVVMVSWWMLTVVIFAAFTGDLTSKLTVSISKFPIQSLEDLISMPHYKAMMPNGTNFYAAVVRANEGPLLKLRSQWVLVKTFDECALNLISNPDPNLVCVTDLSSSMNYANEFCDQIYSAKEYFSPYFLSMAFPKDSYYLPSFDFLLQMGKANGVVGMINSKYIPLTTDCGSSDTAAAEAAAIPLEEVGGAYILTLSLYMCGATILIVELLWVFVLKMSTLRFPGF